MYVYIYIYARHGTQISSQSCLVQLHSKHERGYGYCPDMWEPAPIMPQGWYVLHHVSDLVSYSVMYTAWCKVKPLPESGEGALDKEKCVASTLQ